MSRVIYDDHPWTDDEIAYQLSRGRVNEVAKNKKRFPPGSKVVEEEEDSTVLELSQKVYDYVSSCTVQQLKSDLRKAKLPTNGNETQLRVLLAQHLQELEDDESDA